MNVNRQWLAGVVFGMLTISSAIPRAEAADPPPTEAAIRAAARDWLSANDGIGLTIGIYDNGQRRFINLGSTELDGNRPPTKDTVYEIGGISKVFAGQLLARAIVEGRATLTDDVGKYLSEPYPNLENGGMHVKLQHLVNSTSQLIDNIPDITQVRTVPGESLAATRQKVIEKYTQKEFLLQLHRVRPTMTPGSDPKPSHVGAMLLGVVLEKIHDEPFETLLAREIEKPMRMQSGTSPPVKLLAKGYTRDNEPLPSFGAKTQYAANSLRYSADDLLRFAAWQMVEKDASTKLAHQPTWSTPDGRVSLGFFWVIGAADESKTSPRGRRLLSSGATYGFASVCDLYPDEKIAVVLLSNKSAEGAQDSLRALSAKIVSLLRPAS
jgi:D-alanyl-D-alanine-carboxypeptidase/D-alanyl-D-alanine-endopeptidase